MQDLYGLDDAAWSRIEPLLPRGRRGARRVDDRRVISGISFSVKPYHVGAVTRIAVEFKEGFGNLHPTEGYVVLPGSFPRSGDRVAGR